MPKQQYIDIFNQCRAMINKHGAPVMNGKRDEAFAVFSSTPLPTRKVERYKYTDIPAMLAPDYGLNLNRLEIPANPYDAFKCDVPNLSTLLYFIVNDQFYTKVMPKVSLPEGVFIGSLKTFAEQQPEIVEKYYGEIVKPSAISHQPLASLKERTTKMKKWTVEDAAEMYNIKGWGVNYFGINDKGHVYVAPHKNGVQVDLKEVVDELATRHVTAPMLLRFPDILDNRIEKTADCFKKAAKEYNYQSEHFIIFPIKVNQMRPVVEEIISHGKKYNLGLEAGSKPELPAVLATNMDSDSLIICNGHKDQSFIELALLAQKMGKRVFLVVEKLPEMKIIADCIEIQFRIIKT